MGNWNSEVKCIMWTEKSEAIEKMQQWKYRLISITSDWYHIILPVIDITYLFWYALVSLLIIKEISFPMDPLFETIMIPDNVSLQSFRNEPRHVISNNVAFWQV